MNEYTKQAEKFLKETGTEFKAVFLKNGLHFTGDTEPRDIYKITLTRGKRIYKFDFGQSINNSDGKTKPSAYDVLACLTTSEIGDFKNFCGDFGYDEDSRKAEKTYKAVVKELDNVQKLWNDKEIEQLQEIN